MLCQCHCHWLQNYQHSDTVNTQFTNSTSRWLFQRQTKCRIGLQSEERQKHITKYFFS